MELHSRNIPVLILLLVIFDRYACNNDWLTERVVSQNYTNLEQVAYDAETNSVYIGGKNALLQLNASNLELQAEKFVGPVDDNIQCLPPPLECAYARSSTNNQIKVLEINPSERILLYCGSAKQGLCSVATLHNITRGSEMPPDNVMNYAGGKKSVIAFYGNGLRLSSKVLYSAVTYDGRPNDDKFVPTTISSRKIKSRDGIYNMSFGYLRTDYNIFSGIGIVEQYESQIQGKYIYGFEHGKFSYFVIVEKLPGEGQFITRLARVCQEDANYHSYMEIPLQCGDFNIAQAAYLYKDANFDDLVVAYGKSNGYSDEADKQHGSKVCVYTMAGVKSTFTRALRICYNGQGPHLMSWFHASINSCTRKTPDKPIDDDFCADRVNSAMQGGSSPTQQTSFELSQLATAIVARTYIEDPGDSKKGVAIIGTANGHILKVLLSSTSKQPFLDVQVSDNSNIKIEKDMEMTPQKDFLFVLSSNKLTKFPLNSCRAYNECSSCQSSPDPLGCAWCSDHTGGYCSTKVNCLKSNFGSDSCPPLLLYVTTTKFQLTELPQNLCHAYNECSSCQSSLGCAWCSNHTGGYCSTKGNCLASNLGNDSCPPLLLYFTPSSGPNEGGTRVTIHGRAFGAPSAKKREVRVALTDCAIEEHTSEMIICTTAKRIGTGSFQREVDVTIIDEQRVNGFDIRGNARSSSDFFFHDPKVTSVGPPKGPKSGGTKLVVTGEHLDIGSAATVTVAGFRCDDVKRTQEQLMCHTEQHHERARTLTKRELTSGPVVVTIDSANLDVNGATFTYKDDPVVTDVVPKKSILSGGLSITVSGSSLDVVQTPQMGITVVRDENVTVVVDCVSHDEGSYMVCPSPNLTSTLIEVTPELPLLADIWFVMDNVEDLLNFHQNNPTLARFSYYPDPTVEAFEGKENLTLMYPDNKELIIKGKHLNIGSRPEDVSVLIGEDPCDITELTETMVKCTPRNRPVEPNEDEPLRPVTITIGHIKQVVGHVRYTKVNHAITMGVLIPLAVILVIVGIVLLIVYLRRKEIGIFKPRPEATVEYNSQGITSMGAERERMLSQEGAGLAPDRYARALPSSGGAEGGAEAEPDNTIDEETWLLLQDSHLLIDRADLDIDHDHIIGQGHFGCVFKGVLTREEPHLHVAIKTLHAALSPKEQDLNKFLQEALIMKDFHHENVLELVGICMENKTDMPNVVLPFMRHGDLLSYIRDENKNPTVRDLMQFGVYVARGMSYLSELKFVHRDLAARNCMLGDGMSVKVADFGLSRDVYERDYYSSDDKKAKLPVKWMSLESLEKGVYSSKTDVWSFGIVLWELMTRGVCPYPDVDNWDIIRYLKSGRRMPQPAYCPKELYSIMRQCWEGNSRDRPTFTELVDLVDSVIIALEQKAKGKKAEDDSVYVNVPTNSDYIYQDQASMSTESVTV